MMGNNLTIYDCLYPKYKIKKPIRLIEMFAGYGSQALALKYLGIPFEHWKICEWAIKSIQAYKDVHFPDWNGELDGLYKAEHLYKTLYNEGISSNYNEPMTLEQIKRLGVEKAEEITYNNIVTHNLVNIQQVKGEDLDIRDIDKYTYLFTYSFPCQDLSLAGKQKGMGDTSTRSGMLWEVERILTECKELGNMPEILLMENVPQVHGENNLEYFNKWQLRLEELGYKNYFKDLIATDYGIPQTRNRCFMLSILGDYSYTFPKPIPLKLKLKDMLEENVDEKYFLSDKMIKYITANNEKWTGNNDKSIINKTLASTINTNEGSRRCDASDYISKEVGENYNLKIKNATKKGYLEATIGDGIDISSRMEHHRGTVQKGKSQTLTTTCEVGTITKITEENNLKRKLCNKLIKDNLVQENDVIRHSYTKSRMKGNMKDLKQNNLSHTLDTRCDCLGVVNNLRIRKLTPKECFRLMGVKDEDFEKVRKNQSDSSLYHLAGDSIVVNVLMAIFKELL